MLPVIARNLIDNNVDGLLLLYSATAREGRVVHPRHSKSEQDEDSLHRAVCALAGEGEFVQSDTETRPKTPNPFDMCFQRSAERGATGISGTTLRKRVAHFAQPVASHFAVRRGSTDKDAYENCVLRIEGGEQGGGGSFARGFTRRDLRGAMAGTAVRATEPRSAGGV